MLLQFWICIGRYCCNCTLIFDQTTCVATPSCLLDPECNALQNEPSKEFFEDNYGEQRHCEGVAGSTEKRNLQAPMAGCKP
jgi:hypothetical protein